MCTSCVRLKSCCGRWEDSLILCQPVALSRQLWGKLSYTLFHVIISSWQTLFVPSGEEKWWKGDLMQSQRMAIYNCICRSVEWVTFQNALFIFPPIFVNSKLHSCKDMDAFTQVVRSALDTRVSQELRALPEVLWWGRRSSFTHSHSDTEQTPCSTSFSRVKKKATNQLQ